MKKIAIFLYSLISYLLFFATFLYLIGFVGNLWVPKGIDDGAVIGWLEAVLINSGLIILFGLPHSLMARASFKKWFAQFVSPATERISYVLLSTLLIDLLMWQWRPLPTAVWHFDGLPAGILWFIFAAGWGILLLSTFLINHFELFGLQQGLLQLLNRQPQPTRFVQPFLYKLVRHPMMLGMLIAFWASPIMSLGHLLFASGLTLYIHVGVHLEERDLVAQIGEPYRHYQQDVPMLLPKPRKNSQPLAKQNSS